MPAYNSYTVARLRKLCEHRGISAPDFRYKSEFVNALIEDDAQRIDVVDDDNDDVEPNENNADASDDDNSNDADSVVAVSVNEREMSPVEHAAGGTHENDSVNALRLQVELVRAQQAAAESSWRIEKERIKLTGSGRDPVVANSSRSLGGDAREIKGLLPQMANDEVMVFFQSYERVMVLNNVDYTSVSYTHLTLPTILRV